MSSGFISDGYTETGYIAEVQRLHPALRFEFRPFLPEERSRLITENERHPPIKAAQNTAEKIADSKNGKIKSWDLKDDKGEPVPVSADAFRRIKPALHGRLLGIVMGLDASDEDPDTKPLAIADSPSLADLNTAIETKSPIGDVTDAANVKN